MNDLDDINIIPISIMRCSKEDCEETARYIIYTESGREWTDYMVGTESFYEMCKKHTIELVKKQTKDSKNFSWVTAKDRTDEEIIAMLFRKQL